MRGHITHFQSKLSKFRHCELAKSEGNQQSMKIKIEREKEIWRALETQKF